MNLITNLNSTTSTLAKEAILKDLPYEWWETFTYAYHPDSIYRMTFTRYDMDNLGEPTKGMFNLLNDILDGRLRGDEATTAVKVFANLNGDLIKLVVNKDLRCGVTATTFNKVYPGSIPQFKVQLAKEVPLDKLEYPMLAQIKYDGVRLIAIVGDGKVEFKTRNGKVVNLPKLAETIEGIHATNYILDGEIVYDDGKMDGRTGISGAINSAMHGGIVDESDMVFHVFDTMSKTQFDTCSCNHPYSLRYTTVIHLVGVANSDMLQAAITNEIHDHEGALALYEGVLALGYEGLILKDEKHLYTFKRSKDWVKIKEVKTADITCIGVEEGEGKYIGMIGKLVCKGTVDGKDVTVRVGSGLSDLERGLTVSDYYGQVIEIKYNTVIQDSTTGDWSLFLPRFVTVRTDK